MQQASDPILHFGVWAFDFDPAFCLSVLRMDMLRLPTEVYLYFTEFTTPHATWILTVAEPAPRFEGVRSETLSKNLHDY